MYGHNPVTNIRYSCTCIWHFRIISDILSVGDYCCLVFVVFTVHIRLPISTVLGYKALPNSVLHLKLLPLWNCTCHRGPSRRCRRRSRPCSSSLAASASWRRDGVQRVENTTRLPAFLFCPFHVFTCNRDSRVEKLRSRKELKNRVSYSKLSKHFQVKIYIIIFNKL